MKDMANDDATELVDYDRYVQEVRQRRGDDTVYARGVTRPSKKAKPGPAAQKRKADEQGGTSSALTRPGKKCILAKALLYP